MANSYEYLPVPGVSGVYGDHVPEELLYSYAKFTQKGVTLKGGQGVLLAGTPLAEDPATKKHVKWTAGACQGFLRQGADTGGAGAADQHGNVVISGIVKLEIVKKAIADPTAAVTALNGRIDDARSYISF